MERNLPINGQGKTMREIGLDDISYARFDYLLDLRAKLTAIDKAQNSHVVMLEKFIEFDEDGEGYDTDPASLTVYPVTPTEKSKAKPTVHGWKCHRVDRLIVAVNAALQEEQRSDVVEMFSRTLPDMLKTIKQRTLLKGEFDTADFLAEFLPPMEAQIKAIREQQAQIACDEPNTP